MTLHPLRLRRLELDISQIELSMRSGVPQYYISLIERGFRKAQKWEKEAIADVLKCREDEIFPEDFEPIYRIHRGELNE